MAPESGNRFDRAADYVERILDCYSELCKLPDLKPVPHVSETFEKLVDICKETPREGVTALVRFLLKACC